MCTNTWNIKLPNGINSIGREIYAYRQDPANVNIWNKQKEREPETRGLPQPDIHLYTLQPRHAVFWPHTFGPFDAMQPWFPGICRAI